MSIETIVESNQSVDGDDELTFQICSVIFSPHPQEE